MPTYDYRCAKCGKRFSLTLTIGEHDSRQVSCPKCKSKKVTQQIGNFFCVTSDKS